MFRFLILCLFVPLMLAAPACMKLLTHGFRLSKMTLSFPFHSEWEIKGEVPPQIREILSQPYTYLDRGAQCYVFASEDDQYVIKLFRYDLSQSSPRLRPRLFSFTKKRKTNFQSKILHLFNACKMAYDQAPLETGLVYIHLNPTAKGLPILHCRDSLGRRYALPLDAYRFAVQKKAEPLRKVFKDAIEAQDVKAVERRIDAFLTLLKRRTGLGIHNSDSNWSRNFGFYKECALEIDFGNYRKSKKLLVPAHRLKEIHRFSYPLRKWLYCNAPEYLSYFDARLKFLEEECR
ncbi:MAG: hypothetical protein V4487_00455 [Chlamydiota bacterium]